jgi:hypothetical protein
MSLRDVFQDEKYRALAENVIRSACDEIEVEVAEVEFVQDTYRDDHSWLCCIVDPLSADHASDRTRSSAVDHFRLIDPHGFLKEAGRRITVRVFELEVAHEAPIAVMKGSESVLFSPWMHNLAVLKATFNFATAT